MSVPLIAKGDEPLSDTHTFTTRGIYFHDGFTVDPEWHAPLHWGLEEWERELRWLRACGIDTVEFATMLEFNRIPSTPLEHEKVALRQSLIEMAHDLDMRFSHILSTTVVSTVPPDEEPSHQLNDRAEVLCPRDPGNFERTMEIQTHFLDLHREADLFEVFAADWGGCRCGRCGTEDYLRYVRALAERVAEVNPEALCFANTWAIADWGPSDRPDEGRGFWDIDMAKTREVIDALESLPPNVHLALPCHHLYRPLTFMLHGGQSQTPRFPDTEDIARVRAMGRQVLAWPHFVVDDDAYRAESWGIVHSEVRYIRAMLRSLRDVGIDHVMANLYLPFLQVLNTYAYGRLLENPDLDPREILLDFSGLIAHPDDATTLAEVLAWLENGSWWERQMPPDGRLAPLPCHLTQDLALRRLSGVRPNPDPAMPLPISPEVWLGDLRRSIERMDWVD
jgi:hypothetical protein